MVHSRKKMLYGVIITLFIISVAIKMFFHIEVFLEIYTQISIVTAVIIIYEKISKKKVKIVLMIIVSLSLASEVIKNYVIFSNLLDIGFSIIFTIGLFIEIIRYIKKDTIEKKMNVAILSVTAAVFLTFSSIKYINSTVGYVKSSIEVGEYNYNTRELPKAGEITLGDVKFIVYKNSENVVAVKYKKLVFGRYSEEKIYSNGEMPSKYVVKIESRINNYFDSNSQKAYLLMFGSNEKSEIKNIIVRYYANSSSQFGKEVEFKIPNENFFAIAYVQQNNQPKSIAVYDQQGNEITEKHSNYWY